MLFAVATSAKRKMGFNQRVVQILTRALTPNALMQVPAHDTPEAATEAWMAHHTAAYKAHLEATQRAPAGPKQAAAARRTATAASSGDLGIKSQHWAQGIPASVRESKSHDAVQQAEFSSA